jgi:uncharacterized protein with HEPN domain
MREAAASALEMISGHERGDLASNSMLAMALVRCLEIVGEAASKVGPEIRDHFPTIPFVQMTTMRNRLIHAYFDIDLDIVWTTVRDDLPLLLPALDEALAKLDR